MDAGGLFHFFFCFLSSQIDLKLILYRNMLNEYLYKTRTYVMSTDLSNSMFNLINKYLFEAITQKKLLNRQKFKKLNVFINYFLTTPNARHSICVSGLTDYSMLFSITNLLYS
jgi:hypothetical protein